MTEEATFSTEPSGLKEAAAEVSTARAEGRAVSSPEPEPKEAPPSAVDRRWETGASENGREKPVLPLGFDRGVDPRDASERLAERRQQERLVSEGDAALRAELAQAAGGQLPEDEAQMRQLLEANPELADKIVAASEGMDSERERLAQVAAQAEAQLEAIKADRDQRIRELEQRKAAQAQAAEREKYLASLAAGSSELPRLTHELRTKLASEYPECADEFGVRRLAEQDPTRYQAFQRDFAAANTLLKAQAYEELTARAQLEAHRAQIENSQAQQRMQDNIAFAKREVAKVAERHPEFKDQRKVDEVRDAIYAMRLERDGMSREMVDAEFNSDPGAWRADRLEAVINDARMWRARRELQNGRRNPVHQVQRPGVGREPGSHRGDALNSLYQKADSKKDPKSWGRWLAEARRNAR